MSIHTVLGTIEPMALGRTSMHEHVFVDARVWLSPSSDIPVDTAVTIESLGDIRWAAMAVEDNLVLDDAETAAKELKAAFDTGLRAIVDTTSVGVGRRTADLVDVARHSDVHILCGCGFYVHGAHPSWVDEADVEAIADYMIRELNNGIEDTGVRPALIGEIGTSEEILPCEQRVLRASGRAAAATGAAVSIHLDGRGREGAKALALVAEEGASPSRIILGHLDEHLDIDYHLELAKLGAVLEYDTFGAEFYWGTGFREPSDWDRMRGVATLVEAGYAEQLVLGCDVWTKSQLKQFGGMGYEHLSRRIAPALEATFGLPRSAINAMLVETPRRLLDR